MHMQKYFDWTIGEKGVTIEDKDWKVWSELQRRKQIDFFSLSFFYFFFAWVTLLPVESVSKLLVLRKWWCGPIKSSVLKWVC
jgi:hypothetical protein